MKKTLQLGLALIGLAAFAQEMPPKHELGFALGGFTPLTRSGSNANLDLASGIALQSNYARRVWTGTKVALYGEVHFLASPQRVVASQVQSATRDVASLYVTPGVRVKFFPASKIAPYLAAGGGVAWYEQSRLDLAGAANGAPRERVGGAFDFGGGADVRVWRFLALRGEIRDFYTSSPAYNITALKGGQHNVVTSAAFVIRWR